MGKRKPRLCKVCGKEFHSETGRTCCSDKCSKQADIEARLARRKPQTCQWCGEEFWRRDCSRQKFCSSECLIMAHRAEKPPKDAPTPVRYQVLCGWCGVSFETSYPNQKYCSRECSYKGNLKDHRDAWAAEYQPRIHVCKQCGDEFGTECGDTHSVFCCQSCADKWKRIQDHQTERHRQYMNLYRSKREKQIQQQFVEPILYETLYKRDKGLCQICSLPVLPKGADNDWDGTIDHIIPVSLDGEHSMANCQLAHRICNSLKNRDGKGYHIDWEEKSRENHYWSIKFARLEKLLGGRLRGAKSSRFFAC